MMVIPASHARHTLHTVVTTTCNVLGPLSFRIISSSGINRNRRPDRFRHRRRQSVGHLDPSFRSGQLAHGIRLHCLSRGIQHHSDISCLQQAVRESGCDHVCQVKDDQDTLVWGLSSHESSESRCYHQVRVGNSESIVVIIVSILDAGSKCRRLLYGWVFPCRSDDVHAYSASFQMRKAHIALHLVYR